MIRHCIAAIYFIVMLSACGGDSHSPWSSGSNDAAPSAPLNLAGYAGDGAVNLGWEPPAQGSSPLSYDIIISPDTTGAAITRNGTHAIVRGLTNGTSYTFSVIAKNDAGKSNAVTLLLTPTAVTSDIASLTEIHSDTNDNYNTNGMYEPSLLHISGRLWMAYSSMNYHQVSGDNIQDESTSIAYSDDGGSTFTYLRTIGQATTATVTPDSTTNPCGNVTCTGRWVYQAPFLVEDKTDPDPNRRIKLFAHKYFLYPAATPSTIDSLGAIVMWTAPSPESNWSSERVVLGWSTTPPELSTTNNINSVNTDLKECLALNEGSAATYQGNLDFVFACPNGLSQKVVLLRSSDHASTFKYISTLLASSDAADLNGLYFAAPALIPSESSAPILLATPVLNRSINVNGVSATLNAYSGCIAFPLADEETGKLFRNDSTPLSILQIGYQANHLNGACAWDTGAVSGILMSDGDLSTNTPQFNILKTGKNM